MTPTDLPELLARLRQWFQDPLLRMWLQPAARGADGLFCEALGADGQPLAGRPQRALVAARQAFFFARMAARGDAALWDVAQAQLVLLERHFHDGAQGGVFSRLDRAAPAKELYANAFAVLAFAEGFAHGGDARWLARAERALGELRRGFALPGGELASATSADFGTCLAGPAQNPQMHLFEAVLHLWRRGGQARHAQQLRALAQAVHARFFDPASGAVMELPRGSAGNWLEPGHQCEWYSLLTLAGDLVADLPLAPAVQGAFERACALAARHQGVLPLKLAPDGATLDGSHRIWTQLELVRAVALHGDADRLATTLRALLERFLHPRGWHELISATGEVLRADMPATTPYHLVTCLEALDQAPVPRTM